MKRTSASFRNYLMFVPLISTGLLIAQAPAKKDAPAKKGAFVSLNPAGMGLMGAPANENFTYLIITAESGIWIKQNVLTGISLSTSLLFANRAYKNSYLPLSTNFFVKYFPFKCKYFKCFGIQAQGGFANSGMEFSGPEQKLFPTFGAGPTINLGFGKSALAFNFSLLYLRSIGPSIQPYGSIGKVWPYLGLSYTFKK